MVVVRTSPLTREAYVVLYESRLQSINYIFAWHYIAYHNRDVDGSRSHRELLEEWCFWRSCRHDGKLTSDYTLPRQAPVHNPYFLQFKLYLCIKFKELNETHLHIYLYPMSLTSMTGSCRLLCYRTPVEVE